MLKLNSFYIFFKPFVYFAFSIFYINTVSGQIVAPTIQKKLIWIENPENKTPVLSNFSLSLSKFGTKYMPSITFTIQTNTKNTVEFSNFQFEELTGLNTYKERYLNDLSNVFVTSVYHTMEGSLGHTGIVICPFKSEGGRIYKMTGFDYLLKDGETFASLANNNKKRAAGTSVLANGQWIKFSVISDGLYKLDGNWLTKAGINISSIDPRTIKIYGTQGGMLSEINADFRYDDLPENAIQVIGENDGKFDAGDHIILYAQSPNKWKYNTSLGRYEHIMNIYSDKTYFFLTFGGGNGKRISSEGDGSNLTADKTFDWFDYHIFHDDEKENFCHEGRTVFGEKFDAVNLYNFNNNIANIDGSNPTSVYFYAVAVAPSSSRVSLSVNNSFVTALNFREMPHDDPPCFIQDSQNKIASYSFTTSNPDINLSFSYNKPNSSARAWLDYYELHSTRKLNFSEGFMPFSTISSRTASVAEYRLSNLPSGTQVYDISDPVNVKIQNMYPDNGNSVFKDNTAGTIHEFVMNSGNFLTPAHEGSVNNQNLHGTGIVQFIIVSPPAFTDAANKLADFHRTRDNMSVLVTTPQNIYNEFSGGAQDISAIRDFFKLVYYNNTNPSNQLKYAMFMGDASYDYKDKVANNNNFVPTYESDEHSNGVNLLYCSDDFFGFLDPSDGAWVNSQKLEIPVTRLPAASSEEAMGMVNKIYKYKEATSLGDWRNVVTFLSDDIDDTWETVFLYDFEEIFDKLDKDYKNINVRKVYLDAFKQENLGGSQRYPEVQEAVKKEFEQGTLIFNYMGHGGDEYITSEKVIDIPLANGMQNILNLPAFFTASCSIGKYDDATHKSGGEYFMTNPKGGAIAMFTTSRIVYVTPNADLTKYFWSDCVFVKIGGKWPTLGEVYMKLKNRPSADPNDRRFTLFADPALTLNYPENVVKVDSINNHSTTSGNDTLKALAKVTFKGHVEDISGNPMNSFNGLLYPTIYDKKASFMTMGNNSYNIKLPFELYSNVLYKGESSITSGQYSFSFVVPKDIAYNYGYGKVSLYGKNENTDASGNVPNLLVGGTSSNIVADNKGPEIELFVDDFSFISGGLSDKTPLLLARISDENGVNTSGSGIGRDLLITIDKGTINEKSYVVNRFYKSNLNSYTTGEIKYQLENIEDGKHTYTLKVWDVYNNSSETSIEFNVSNGESFQIKNLLNYPNPFSTNTVFHFDHNRAGQNLTVVITVFTISGKVIKTIDQFIPASSGHVSEISWNGRDDYDDKMSRGVYIYRINIKTDDGQSIEKIEKLVILN